MTETIGEEKRYLSYQGANFKRAGIYFVIAWILLCGCYFINFKPSVPPPGGVPGPPLSQILMMVIAICLILNCISDLLFVTNQNYLQTKKYAFDSKNFYIIEGNSISQIPLEKIFQLSLVYRQLNSGTRGYSRSYRISFRVEGEEKEIILVVYAKMSKNYEDFKKLVIEKNPSLEIIDAVTNFDWIGRLIKKSKSKSTGNYFQ